MVNNIKDLAKIIQLCQKEGVESLKLGDFELKLGAVPHKAPKAKDNVRYNAPSPFDPGQLMPMDDKIATSELSEEELLYYSTGTNQ